jgi:uncharacterized membrane protein YoaK (UPF0700 family)
MSSRAGGRPSTGCRLDIVRVVCCVDGVVIRRWGSSGSLGPTGSSAWDVSPARPRSDRQHRILAGYLAFVGGFVNSVGFVLIGTFTSHVTGNVGRAANAFASGQGASGLAAATMIVTFFAGAFLASVLVESSILGHTSRAYAVALGVEALLLGGFAVWSRFPGSAGPRLQDVQALLLCGAMGMQNSLVTRLSGAVVRTTHLTGVVTDLGIEAARWFRHWRSVVSRKLHIKLVAGDNLVERPLVPKALLLLTIACAFVLGAALGSVLVVRWMHATMGLAALAVALFASYAAILGGAREDDVAKSRK